MPRIVLPLFAAGLAVIALVLPWTFNAECRVTDFLWDVPTRRTPATATLLAAALGGIGVVAASLLAIRRRLLVILAIAALAAAVVAAVTLPLGSCLWEDSRGGGSSESIWGPGPVVLLAAALLATGAVLAGVPKRREAAQ